jgi:hypothetical protein
MKQHIFFKQDGIEVKWTIVHNLYKHRLNLNDALVIYLTIHRRIHSTINSDFCLSIQINSLDRLSN